MSSNVIIDGNNLLFAMHQHAPVAHVGRETLFRVVDRWARRCDQKVTLVFDGPVPRGGLDRQMQSSRVTVRFSAPETADDVIIRMVNNAQHPTELRVVTGDSVIRHAAKYRRSAHTECVAFVAELFSAEGEAAPTPSQPGDDKPRTPTGQETSDWLQAFDIEVDDEPFDGYGAMTDE